MQRGISVVVAAAATATAAAAAAARLRSRLCMLGSSPAGLFPRLRRLLLNGLPRLLLLLLLLLLPGVGSLLCFPRLRRLLGS